MMVLVSQQGMSNDAASQLWAIVSIEMLSLVLFTIYYLDLTIVILTIYYLWLFPIEFSEDVLRSDGDVHVLPPSLVKKSSV